MYSYRISTYFLIKIFGPKVKNKFKGTISQNCDEYKVIISAIKRPYQLDVIVMFWRVKEKESIRVLARSISLSPQTSGDKNKQLNKNKVDNFSGIIIPNQSKAVVSKAWTSRSARALMVPPLTAFTQGWS